MRRHQQGFTLIQMALYIAVSSIILFTASGVLINLLELKEKARVTAEVDQQGQFVLQKISQLVRNAEAITAPTPGSSGASLTLDVVTAGDDPTVIALSSGTVQITEGAAAAVDLTSSQVEVTSLTFENASTANSDYGSIRVTIAIEHSSTSNRNEYSYAQTMQTSISLR